MIKENLIQYFEESIRQNWEKPAFSDFKGEKFNYSDVAKKILVIHKVLKNNGIKKGSKIALVGKNSSNWAISYLSIISYGGVVVPLLPDFKPEDIMGLINHSDAEVLFISDSHFESVFLNKIQRIKLVFLLSDFAVLSTSLGSGMQFVPLMNEMKEDNISAEGFHLPEVDNSELAVISYTSGTTSNSKGVMLSHNNLAANIRFARNNMPLSSGDSIVSFLPLAHAYGCAFEFLFPFSLGCFITFLTKVPSPQIIIQAFAEVKPRLVLSVPLVIEKIYKKQILPVISKPIMQVLLRLPLINKILYFKIKQKLIRVFGGNFHEVVIGGAPFNMEAEAFLKKIHFPFTVGYGMTECGPLISYSSWKTTKIQSSGKPVDTLHVKIDSADPLNIVGEIMVRGDNVMLGYYKNDEATQAVLEKDGWLHTGDLGLIDKEGNVYIKGRCKSMILGASGQNIYPEEIESVLNNKYGVMESLVILDNGQLKALIYPDYETIENVKIEKDQLMQIMKQNVHELNHQLPAYMNISKFEIHPVEFEKTPKRSIKRFLYN